MNYREAIDWLFATQMFGIKLGLEGTRILLHEYLAFPAPGVTVIHVAGTNGKGSTCAIIDSIARASGRRCGLFTSPHLIDYRERIKVSGEEIPEMDCAAMLTELREICETMKTHPTFFEISLVLAMKWFRKSGCELITLETGMGGRLDATTAVPADVCVITPIGLDHTQCLGETLGAIASEKAGIIELGKPVVSAPQESIARFILEQEANERRAPLTFISESLLGYSVPLAGEHQRWNAALALAALHKSGVPLNPDIVRSGLSMLSWPGRFEEICDGVILDGAHNPHAARVLAETWQSEFPGIKPSLIFSAVMAKDVAGILEILAPIAARILLCPVDTPRAMPAEELAKYLPEGSPPHKIFPTFGSAFDAAIKHDAPVLVAGSLFLVGEARARLTKTAFQSSSQ